MFEVPYKIKSTIFPWLRSSRSSDYYNGRSLGFIQGGGSPSAWCQRGTPHSPCWEKRDTSIVSTFLSTSYLEDWNDTRIFPVLWYFFGFPDLQGQFLRARGDFYTAMFSDFRRYTTPSSRRFTFLCCIDCIQQFLEFMFFIKTCNVWPLRNGVQGRAISYSCYILKLVKVVCKSTVKTHLSPAGLSHHQRH